VERLDRSKTNFVGSQEMYPRGEPVLVQMYEMEKIESVRTKLVEENPYSLFVFVAAYSEQ
jgi:hypothetical protein